MCKIPIPLVAYELYIEMFSSKKRPDINYNITTSKIIINDERASLQNKCSEGLRWKLLFMWWSSWHMRDNMIFGDGDGRCTLGPDLKGKTM